MEIIPLLFRQVIGLCLAVLSAIFFLMSIYYGYKYLDGIKSTRKAIKASTCYLSLCAICALAALFISALPAKEVLLMIAILLGVVLLIYYAVGLASIKIEEKISKFANKK